MDALLDQTKAELEKVKAELAAREESIRAPLAAEQKRVDALRVELETTRAQINIVKAGGNAARPRGPFLTRTASIARVGAALVAGVFALQLAFAEPWLTVVPVLVLIVSTSRPVRE